MDIRPPIQAPTNLCTAPSLEREARQLRHLNAALMARAAAHAVDDGREDDYCLDVRRFGGDFEHVVIYFAAGVLLNERLNLLDAGEVVVCLVAWLAESVVGDLGGCEGACA